jgi:hypothetical protein
MVTTPVAILSNVCAQFAGVPGLPATGMPGTGVAVRAGAAEVADVADVAEVADGALNAGETDNANTDKSSEMRNMPILEAFNGQVK